MPNKKDSRAHCQSYQTNDATGEKSRIRTEREEFAYINHDFIL